MEKLTEDNFIGVLHDIFGEKDIDNAIKVYNEALEIGFDKALEQVKIVAQMKLKEKPMNKKEKDLATRAKKPMVDGAGQMKKVAIENIKNISKDKKISIG